jgi:hypothetical protein
MRRLFKRRRSERGQSVVEFALLVPLLMVMVMGMIEMGFAISHNTAIVTATRQGSRVASQMVNGSPIHKCSDATAAGIAGAATVDPLIIGAVEGALVSPGSPTSLAQVQSIEIFLATDTGGVSGGNINTWIPAPGAGPILPGSPAPGTKLDFKPSNSPWNATTRCGAATAQNIGVRITYTYNFITPLGNLVASFSSAKITMTDQTVMAMEPPTP